MGEGTSWETLLSQAGQNHLLKLQQEIGITWAPTPSAKEVRARVICISSAHWQGREGVPEEAWVPRGLMLLGRAGMQGPPLQSPLRSIHWDLQTRRKLSAQTN